MQTLALDIDAFPSLRLACLGGWWRGYTGRSPRGPRAMPGIAAVLDRDSLLEAPRCAPSIEPRAEHHCSYTWSHKIKELC